MLIAQFNRLGRSAASRGLMWWTAPAPSNELP